VVKRFFEIIKPDKAFFGSKDYQQVLVVKALVKQMNVPIEIVTCPTLREFDGLAMSSRNALLSPKERRTSGMIPELMQEAAAIAKKDGIAAAKQHVAAQVVKMDAAKLDYFEVCDADSLQILSDLKPGTKAVALIALYVGKIRLIDNLLVD
jgi:pantoate--beta-alanine ligase